MGSSESTDVLLDEFKAAMRQLAATVSLVTTNEAGVCHGMPATAVSSLSASPPSLLVCINRSASMHGPTSRSRHFCINMLARDQADFCQEFGARAGSDRFKVGRWLTGPHGLPYLDHGAASLFCSVEKQMDYGTHTVFAGRVESIIVDPPSAPLVFQAGRMGGFIPLDAVQAEACHR
jgi:flavin reductase